MSSRENDIIIDLAWSVFFLFLLPKTIYLSVVDTLDRNAAGAYLYILSTIFLTLVFALAVRDLYRSHR